MKKAAGIVIIARDTNRMLLLHRSTPPIVWSVLSGTMEDGESPKKTIKREIKEEIGINPDKIDGIRKVGSEVFERSIKSGKVEFHIFIGFVDKEFKIKNLKLDENDSYGWFDENNLPSPIHKRWPKTFQLVKPILNLRKNLKEQIKKIL
jgi:8-oxo-dGTP pyrophosphatase MutT (NUDIX family)